MVYMVILTNAVIDNPSPDGSLEEAGAAVTAEYSVVLA